MGRKLNISQPAVIQTELRPFNESFWIDANGQLEQWYYQNTGVFAPDRQITALCLTPMLSLLDLDTNTSYSSSASQQAEQPPLYVGFQSVEWKVKEWSGSAWVERTITSVSAGDNYYLNGNDLYVRKNNYDAAHAINITCRANYQDPRDVGTTCWLETTLMLSTNMDATQVYPTIDIKNPSARMFNPLKDDPIYEFEGTCDWSALEGQGGVNITECKVDPLGTEEIIPTNEEMVLNAAPTLNIHYGDIEKANQQFMYRQTANGEVEEIAGGVSAIDNIKGNTVLFNQQFTPFDTQQVIVNASGNATKTYSNGEVSITINSAAQDSDNRQYFIDKLAILGHKYMFGFFAKSNDSISLRIGLNESPTGVISLSSSYQRVIQLSTPTSDNAPVYWDMQTTSPSGGTMVITNRFLIDLTAMGIDNLTTVADVESWLANNIGLKDYYEYCSGKLVNFGGYGVKWNQVVQNGNFADGTTNWIPYGSTITVENKICTSVCTYAVTTGIYCYVSFVLGHKYFIKADCKVSLQNSNQGVMRFVFSNGGEGDTLNFTLQNNTWAKTKGFLSCTGNYGRLYIISALAGGDFTTGDTIQFKNIQLIDLTLMFGAGNEPDLDWCDKYFSKDYYPYCPSVEKNILDVMTTKEVVDGVAQYKSPEMGIKTTGFNQWDEQWEAGSYDGTTGEKITYNTRIRSKNPIRVLPDTEYYIKCQQYAYLFFYDAGGNYLSNTSRKNATFTTPTNCAYINLACDGTTYNHDICINISDPSRNGTYEPYWESKSDMSWITKIGIENFNIWDEEWEAGYYSTSTGEPVDDASYIRSKNLCNIVGGKQYYVKTAGSDMDILFFDGNRNYISNFTARNNDQSFRLFTAPSNAKYFHLYLADIYGTTYNHDICINLSNDHFNGRYYPHGDTAPYFPNGLCKAGSVVDEVKVQGGKINGVVRFGVVTLDNLPWNYSSGAHYVNNFATYAQGLKYPPSNSQVINGATTNYKLVSENSWQSGGFYISPVSSGGQAGLTSAQSNPPVGSLIYELATPYEFEIDYPTKGQFEWYGVDGSGNEVPIDQLPIYSQATQPSGYGQGTSRININALYGENIPVILRVKRYPWSSGLLPMKVTKSVAWKVPPIDVIVTSNKGGAVRAEHMVTPTNFTFSPIVNQQGEVISDDVKEANLVFKWYYVKYGVTGQAVTQLVGTGQTIDISTNTLINTTPQQEGAVKQSTNVYCEVYLLGAYHLVNGSYVRTID